MDPNETLKQLREEVAEALLQSEKSGADPLRDSIAEKFSALDEWISRGGFFPREWCKGQADATDPALSTVRRLVVASRSISNAIRNGEAKSCLAFLHQLDAVDRLADAVVELDTRLSGGGPLPEDWSKNR